MSAGNVKREKIQSIKKNLVAQGADADEGKITETLNEQEVSSLIDSLTYVTNLFGEL